MAFKKINSKTILVRILQVTVLLIALALLLMQCNVIWRSPKSYLPAKQVPLRRSIMSLEEYTSSGLINIHARPYTYIVENKSGKGAVLVFGAEHTNDPENKQLPELKRQWEKFDPTVAMVEGRLGFLFSWFQDPVRKLGEGGLAAKLAKANGVKLYSWEPGRDAEIEYLLKSYDPLHIAVFFCLRPYRGNYAGLSTAEADRVMKKLIAERTSKPGIKGKLTTVEQVDSVWKADHPGLENWRTYQHPQNGWPDGIFKQMAEETNLLRDDYMCNSIIDLVSKGERVFITMGASHAPRIEKALKENLH